MDSTANLMLIVFMLPMVIFEIWKLIKPKKPRKPQSTDYFFSQEYYDLINNVRPNGCQRSLENSSNDMAKGV